MILGGDNMEKLNITIEEIDLRIIYIRFRGSYIEFRKNSNSLFKKLFAFATKNDLIVEDITKVLTIYNDNPFITDGKNLRTSIAMTVPKDVEIIEEDEITIGYINGKFGVGHFEINRNEYNQAWEYMYNQWLFKGNESPRDAIPFELYVTEPPKNAKDKSFTDIYIPIE